MIQLETPFASGHTHGVEAQGPRKFVLRTPTEDSLLPDQVRNEVAFLTYVKQHVPSVPVPAVYAFDTGESGPDAVPFIAMEYVEGEQLSSIWRTLSEGRKFAVAHQIAEISLALAEKTFDGIGGLMPDHTLAPTVEGVKLFKGRAKFHSHRCYNIGPYRSKKEYAFAHYDEEIYYYTHASDRDIDSDFFKKTSKSEFVQTLREERQKLVDGAGRFLPDDPFVLCHGDLDARNMMYKDGKIAAVLDWEFAGTFPLSEFFGGGAIDVTDMNEEDDLDENILWEDRIAVLIRQEGEKRGWPQARIDLLLGDGDPELGHAVRERFP